MDARGEFNYVPNDLSGRSPSVTRMEARGELNYVHGAKGKVEHMASGMERAGVGRIVGSTLKTLKTPEGARRKRR